MPRNHLPSPVQPSSVGQNSFNNRLDPNLHYTNTSVVENPMGYIPDSMPDNSIPQRASNYSLDLLSDAAHHLASDHYKNELYSRSIPIPTSEVLPPEPQSAVAYEVGLDEDTAMRNTDPSLMDDYNLFLDESDLNSNFFSAFDTSIPVSFWSKPAMTESFGQYDDSRNSANDNLDERNTFSRFGSRLPSLQPEQRDGGSNDVPRTSDENNTKGPPWTVSARDYRAIQSKLEDFSAVLPSGFALPLRRTLSRYIEGYISGFHEHMPCLHISTLIAVNLAPELLLAIAGIGAQYRFEGYRGNRLWYAARAVALEQLRRRNTQQVLDIISPPATSRLETPGQTPQPSRSSEVPFSGSINV
jgi:hypothetical protein